MSQDSNDDQRSEVEHLKQRSRHLRGTLEQSLNDAVTGALREGDPQLGKFHGFYQQDDRDLRVERLRRKLEPAWSYMIRVRMPAGLCSPQQWLALSALARTHANGTLRLTTRQAFQYHGVIKRELKATMQGINATLLDTIAACGDVNRNVMVTARSELAAVHEAAVADARAVSEHLLPRTRAYHEIWLDGEKLAGETDEEPIYGATYLPRKFKISFAIPPVNDVDVYAQDLGFVAVVENGALAGYTVTVGGGMGVTHGDDATYPRLADPLGFVTRDQVVAVAEQVVCVQRDYGDRGNRKHARLKYTIADRGLDWFRGEVEARLGFALQPPRETAFETNGDAFGWTRCDDDRWNLTLFVPGGRLLDNDKVRSLRALEQLAEDHARGFILTGNQNVVVTGIDAASRETVDALLAESGLAALQPAHPLEARAIACVALPTCALAMAEAERALPSLTGEVHARLERHGLGDQPVSLRVSGCPNGCSRPYLAEIALVGKAPGRYNLHLGGDLRGERLNRLYAENLPEDRILDTLDGLFAKYSAERDTDEPFGDFLHRSGVLGAHAGGEGRADA